MLLWALALASRDAHRPPKRKPHLCRRHRKQRTGRKCPRHRSSCRRGLRNAGLVKCSGHRGTLIATGWARTTLRFLNCPAFCASFVETGYPKETLCRSHPSVTEPRVVRPRMSPRFLVEEKSDLQTRKLLSRAALAWKSGSNTRVREHAVMSPSLPVRRRACTISVLISFRG